MTGGEQLRAAITAASPSTDAGSRVRQDAADEDDQYPFIIFRRVGVERQRGLDGTLFSMRETFQVECWGQTREESDALEQQAIEALQAAGLYADGNEVDGLDPEVKVRAAVFSIDVWTTYPVV